MLDSSCHLLSDNTCLADQFDLDPVSMDNNINVIIVCMTSCFIKFQRMNFAILLRHLYGYWFIGGGKGGTGGVMAPLKF